MAAPRLPACVIDCGTGYTKMGYAGNAFPNYVVPTSIATKGASGPSGRAQPGGVEDLDFFIGDEAEAQRKFKETWVVESPIEHGQIKNWDFIERFWQHCIFKYMRCEPEEHCFMLTEPPMNAPENREYTAEIMFETFNVKGLYIAVQAVLALWASRVGKKTDVLTGTVIDSGDGVTHVIPVVHGYPIGSLIKTMDIAGKDITRFVQDLMSSREKDIPTELRYSTAKKVKERFCYTCPDIAKEFAKYDKDQAKWVRQFQGVHPRTKEPWECDVGYERFLAPEVFFNPEICGGARGSGQIYKTPLSEMVYECVDKSAIDNRRGLFDNIVLSGGSSMFKDFDRRLQRDIQKICDNKSKRNEELTGVATKNPIKVNVNKHNFQRFAVWFGGSLVASQDLFYPQVKTKAIYDEFGPACCRHNIAIGG